MLIEPLSDDLDSNEVLQQKLERMTQQMMVFRRAYELVQVLSSIAPFEGK
jgi:hypothetical protein